MCLTSKILIDSLQFCQHSVVVVVQNFATWTVAYMATVWVTPASAPLVGLESTVTSNSATRGKLQSILCQYTNGYFLKICVK